MRRVVVAVVLLGGLALPGTLASAQVGIARGRVIDPEGRPVQGATVVLEFQGGVSSRYELATNKKGEYMQVGLTPGPYRVTASKEGFQPGSLEARVGLGSPTDFPGIRLATVSTTPEPGPEPEGLREKFSQAVGQLQAGQLDEAETLLREILEARPDLPQIHQNLAYIYARRKEWAKAEASYLAALELQPGSSKLMTSLAKVYLDAGEDEKAMEMLSRAASADAADATAQFNLGVALLGAEKDAEAGEAFEAALAADASMAEAHYHLGVILVRQGKVTEAIEQLEAYRAGSAEDAPNAPTARGLLEALRK